MEHYLKLELSLTIDSIFSLRPLKKFTYSIKIHEHKLMS